MSTDTIPSPPVKTCDVCRRLNFCELVRDAWMCWDLCAKGMKAVIEEIETKDVPKQRADGRDEWATPWEVFYNICEIWNLTPDIDLFADANNTKCERFLTIEHDALSQPWHELGTVGWLQPPYSQPIMTLAIEKAIFESHFGFNSLFLLPDNIDHEWYDLILPYEHKPWRNPNQKPGSKTYRIKFEPPAGIKPSTPRYGNIHGVIRDPWRAVL
ncbi:MAG TPA: DNA N-6-adenine-methyltransferase [Candidatus Obscuribacterales bacterium]